MTQLTRGNWFYGAFVLCMLSFATAGWTQQVPVIIEHPQSQVVALNGNITLSVTVSSASPNARFQWRLNGGNIPGETQNSFSKTNIQAADAGLYSVVVHNDVGAVSSRNAEVRFINVPFAPFSDFIANSPSFTAVSGLVQGVNFDATAEPGEPKHAGKTPRRSVWATWVSPGNAEGIVTFRTAGSTFDTILAAYTGSPTAGLTEVGSDDDGATFLTSRIRFRTQRQTAYRIVIDGFGGAEGIFLLDWQFEPSPDHLPVILTQPSDETVLPDSEVVFRVAGQSNYTWQWFFNGQPLPNQTDSILVVKAASPDTVGEYFCRAFSGNRFRDTRVARLQVNQNDLGGADPFARTSEKLFDSRQSASDDLRKAAKTVAHGYSGTQIFTTIGATKEVGEPNHCGVAGGASEWFAYQAEANGTLFIDTDGSNFDTVLAAYTGPGDSFATLVSAGCDNNSGLDGKDSRVVIPNATVGTIYWIAVDGVNNPMTGQPAKGSVVLHFRLVLPLKLSAMAYTNTAGGRMSFKVSGTPNLAATIEGSTSVDTPLWTPLTTNSTATGQFNYTNNGVGVMPYRFYRAVNKF